MDFSGVLCGTPPPGASPFWVAAVGFSSTPAGGIFRSSSKDSSPRGVPLGTSYFRPGGSSRPLGGNDPGVEGHPVGVVPDSDPPGGNPGNPYESP